MCLGVSWGNQTDFPWIMAIVLARCTVLFKLKVYGKINNYNIISFIMYLFLKIHCFYLRVVSCCFYSKRGPAQGYTVKVVCIKIPIQYCL